MKGVIQRTGKGNKLNERSVSGGAIDTNDDTAKRNDDTGQIHTRTTYRIFGASGFFLLQDHVRKDTDKGSNDENGNNDTEAPAIDLGRLGLRVFFNVGNLFLDFAIGAATLTGSTSGGLRATHRAVAIFIITKFHASIILLIPIFHSRGKMVVRVFFFKALHPVCRWKK